MKSVFCFHEPLFYVYIFLYGLKETGLQPQNTIAWANISVVSVPLSWLIHQQRSLLERETVWKWTFTISCTIVHPICWLDDTVYLFISCILLSKSASIQNYDKIIFSEFWEFFFWDLYERCSLEVQLTQQAQGELDCADHRSSKFIAWKLLKFQQQKINVAVWKNISWDA